ERCQGGGGPVEGGVEGGGVGGDQAAEAIRVFGDGEEEGVQEAEEGEGEPAEDEGGEEAADAGGAAERRVDWSVEEGGLAAGRSSGHGHQAPKRSGSRWARARRIAQAPAQARTGNSARL